MPGPLSGIKVLDFTALLPGPFASMMLADLGADVVKVEGPTRPDTMRFNFPRDGEESGGHQAINRSKRSIAIDLKNPAGVEAVKKLVKTFDVVMEQFRPGVMDRLGVGYEDLKAINPKVIYCSITGYGQSGPYKLRAGHDINYISMAGISSFAGRKSVGPAPLPVQVADIGAGAYNSVVSILAAVIHRQNSGEGQFIDVSMFDGCVAWTTFQAVNYLVGGENPKREGEFLNGGMHFYNFYETKDGKFMSVGSIEPQFYKDLCIGIGREDLLSRQMAFDDEAEALKKELVEVFKTKTRDEWTEIFKDLDACVEPVLTVEEMSQHPHTIDREMIIELPNAEGGMQKQIGSPFKMSTTNPEYKFSGAKLGEHTQEILQEGGFSEAEIKELKAAGVFG